MLEAARVVYTILKNPSIAIGEKKKKEYEELIAPHEVYLEAVPTTVIFSVLFIVSQGVLCLLIESTHIL